MEYVLIDIPTIIDSSDNKPKLLKPKRSAFIFINTEDDSSNIALEDLHKIEKVDEGHLSRGVYDLVAKVSGESLDDLREDVLKRIRNITSIKSRLTLTVI